MPHGIRRALVVGIAALLGWGMLVLPRLSWASPSELWGVTALFILCGLPTVLFVAGHPCRIPFMPAWGLLYFMMFGSGMLNRATQFTYQSFDPAVFGEALALAVLGAAVCLAMFYTPLGQWVDQLVPQTRVRWNARRAPRIGVFLVALGAIASGIKDHVPLALQQVVIVGTQFGSIGMLCLFLLQLRGQLSKPLTLLLWGVIVPWQVLSGLGSGFLYQVVYALVPLMLCYAAERRTIPWKAVVIAIVCLVPFSGVKQEYRSMAWQEQQGPVAMGDSPIQRGWAFVQLVFLRFSETGSTTYESAAETTQLRADQLFTLAIVKEMTPEAVPFWNGETYADFLWSFLPRLLFPNKPERILGHTFGQRYGLLDPDDIVTSYNVPYQVIEMYINFGTLGVLVGMMLIGLVYRAIAAYLAHPQIGERELLIGCTVFTTLLNTESNFSLVFGGVCWFLLIAAVGLRVLGRADADEDTEGAP